MGALQTATVTTSSRKQTCYFRSKQKDLASARRQQEVTVNIRTRSSQTSQTQEQEESTVDFNFQTFEDVALSFRISC